MCVSSGLDLADVSFRLNMLHLLFRDGYFAFYYLFDWFVMEKDEFHVFFVLFFLCFIFIFNQLHG